MRQRGKSEILNILKKTFVKMMKMEFEDKEFNWEDLQEFLLLYKLDFNTGTRHNKPAWMETTMKKYKIKGTKSYTFDKERKTRRENELKGIYDYDIEVKIFDTENPEVTLTKPDEIFYDKEEIRQTLELIPVTVYDTVNVIGAKYARIDGGYVDTEKLLSRKEAEDFLFDEIRNRLKNT
jgi:hypothetical protein